MVILKSNVIKEYVVSAGNIDLLIHLIRKGNVLIPTVVKVVKNEQTNQEKEDNVGKES